MRLRRLSGRRADPRSDAIIFALLLALLVWVPLPWGSRPPMAAAFFAFAALALMAWHCSLMLRRRAPLPDLPRAAWTALALWGAWIAWVALELVPLPGGVLAALKPAAAEAHAAVPALAAAPLDTATILPGATADELLLTLAYFSVFWLTLVTTYHRRFRQRRVLQVLVISGLAQALYAIVMTLSGIEYGFFEPKQFNAGFATGTFVNQNHFAGYLELALAAGTALVLMDLAPRPAGSWRALADSLVELALSPRLRTRVMLAIMVIALVLTRSRMGNIALFSSLAVCGSLYMLLRHKPYFARALILFVSFFLVDLWIVSDRYGLQKVAERIEQTQLQTEGRTQVTLELGPVVRQYWLTGSGLGTFAVAYAPFRSPQVRAYYDHAHDDHLEFLIETGVIGYALLAALGITVLVHGALTVRRRHDPGACALGFAGAMAVTCLAIHGVADFNLHIPAVAGTLVALMGLSLSCSSVPRSRPEADAAVNRFAEKPIDPAA